MTGARRAGVAPGAAVRALGPVRALGLVMGLVLGLAACGGGGSGGPIAGPGGGAGGGGGTTAPLAAPGTWVVLGSSTAAGVGAPAGRGWVDALATQMLARGVGIANLARSGLQSSQALPLGTPLPLDRPPPDPQANVDAALLRTPTLLLLAFPTNDTVAGVPAADTVAAWRRISETAAAGGAATLVLGTQPRAGLGAAQRATLDAIDRDAAAAFGPCFVALRAGLAGPDGAIAVAYSAGDGIHLNAAGHAWVQARVAEVLDGGRCVRLAP
jgi:lysophospholipase L1-like esterase